MCLIYKSDIYNVNNVSINKNIVCHCQTDGDDMVASFCSIMALLNDIYR